MQVQYGMIIQRGLNMKPAVIRSIALVCMAVIIMVLSYQYGKQQGAVQITPTNLPSPTAEQVSPTPIIDATASATASPSASPIASVKPSASPITLIKLPKMTLKPVTMATPTPTPTPVMTLSPAAIQKLNIQKVPSF
jgi:hypothetical protein